MSPLITSICIGLLCIVTYLIREYIAVRYQRVEYSWDEALDVQRKKNLLIPDLQKISTISILFERRILRELIDARAALDLLTVTGIDTKNIIDAEAKIKCLINKTKLSSEDFPHIAGSPAYQALMDEMASIQIEAQQVMTDYNKTVESYNKLLRLFPFSLVNLLFNRKSPVDLFVEVESQG